MSKNIKLRFSFKKLTAINEAWPYLEFIRPTTPEQRAIVSQMQSLAAKFKKKAINIEYNYDPTSEYSIGLKAHEAYFLEKYLRGIVKDMGMDYSRTVVYQTADLLNQKLA